MNLLWITLSLMFGAGGLVTFVLGRRLAGQPGFVRTLLQVMGGLLMLAAVVGIVAEVVS